MNTEDGANFVYLEVSTKIVGRSFSQRQCSSIEINKSEAEKANKSIINRKAMVFLCLNCIFYESIAGINTQIVIVIGEIGVIFIYLLAESYVADWP